MATRINLDGVESPGEAGVVEEADEPLAEEGNGVVMLDTFFLCRDGDGDGDGGPLISDNVSGASKHYYMKHAAKYQHRGEECHRMLFPRVYVSCHKIPS